MYDDNSLYRYRRLGILGSGQLARMLAEAALRQDLRVAVLSPDGEVPAAIPGVHLHRGRPDDTVDLQRFCRSCDVLTIENEFLDTQVLGRIQVAQPQLRIRPGPTAIALAQDKLAQKDTFQRLHIATADFQPVSSDSIVQQRSDLERRFPAGFLLKWSRFGYDGRGNLPVTPDTPTIDLVRFCRAGEVAGARIYAEERIAFIAECAMVAIRSAGGSMRFLPLTWTRQEAGVCLEVVAPGACLGLPASAVATAQRVVHSLADSWQFCGSLAVEFFLTRSGQLLVNEVAPRVHNTGHFSLYSGLVSQFDLHVQAVMDLPLAVPRYPQPQIMRNILGPADVSPGQPCPQPQLAPPPGVELYWYDKPTVSPGRKMGHLCVSAEDSATVADQRRVLAQFEQRLWQELRDRSTRDRSTVGRSATPGPVLHAS